MNMHVREIPGTQPTGGQALEGRRGLVLGVANEHSIAWGCARMAHARGARLVMSCLNEKAHPHVAPLAEVLDAPLHHCNVEEPGALAQLVEAAAAHMGGLISFGRGLQPGDVHFMPFLRRLGAGGRAAHAGRGHPGRLAKGTRLRPQRQGAHALVHRRAVRCAGRVRACSLPRLSFFTQSGTEFVLVARSGLGR